MGRRTLAGDRETVKPSATPNKRRCDVRDNRYIAPAWRATRSGANPSRIRLYEFVARAAASTPSSSRVLDAGAGDLPYADLWRHTQYESADVGRIHGHETELDYLCDLESIPVEDHRFDAVLLTQVLEHVVEPQAVLHELHRVTKPGGKLWLSAPLFYEQHEVPHDYYRYTEFGIVSQVERAGFVVDEVDWLEGYFGTMAYQASSAARFIPRKSRAYGGGVTGLLLAAVAWPSAAIALGLSRVLGALELRYKVTSSGYPKNFTVVAHKPDGPERGGNGG
jgi:SAM-dependent methyltransferase